MLLNRLFFKAPTISLCALACISLAGCREAPRQVQASSPAPVAVSTVIAEAVDWPSVSEAAGTVRARTSTVIASKVMGYVRQVKFQIGDSVAAGQLLLVLDSRDLDAAYRQAAQAKEEAVQVAAEANNAEASAQASLDLAKITFQRMNTLYEKKSISNQEYDEASAKLKVAQAMYDMAVSRRAQVGARIQQAQEAVSAADVMRGYAEIRAPFAGAITTKNVEEGLLATPGTPLLTIEQAVTYLLEVPVEEEFLASTKVGQSVDVKLDSFDQKIAARISEIVPSVDPASRAFVVKIDLPAVAHLRSGVFGRAQFSRGERRVIAVPPEAVSENGQVQTLLVADNGFAHERIVTTGQHQGPLVEILSGLNAGELVVSPRPAGLADGARLETHP